MPWLAAARLRDHLKQVRAGGGALRTAVAKVSAIAQSRWRALPMGLGAAWSSASRTRRPGCSSACTRSFRRAAIGAMPRAGWPSRHWMRRTTTVRSQLDRRGARRPKSDAEDSRVCPVPPRPGAGEQGRLAEGGRGVHGAGQGVSRRPAAAGCRVLDRRGATIAKATTPPPGPAVGTACPAGPAKARTVDGDGSLAAPGAGVAKPVERRLRRSPRRSPGTFPDFEQQYEVDYLLGRCLANQADFEAAGRPTSG